jgi:hypothetical protein
LIKSKLDFIKELRSSKSIATEEASDSIYCNVFIKDKKFRIYCGQGKQKLRWLTDVAIYNYKAYSGQICGLACFVKLEDGNICELEEVIKDTVKSNENVWVMFKEEYEVYTDQLNKKYVPYSNNSNKSVRLNTKQSTRKELNNLDL